MQSYNILIFLLIPPEKAGMMPSVSSSVDTLFHSVRRGEVDICKSPLAPTIQAFCDSWDFDCSLDGIGEILVAAATLVYVKSRCFLPSPSFDEEEEDPPEDGEALHLEYQGVKEAAMTLQEREAAWAHVFRRPVLARGEETFSWEVTLFDLLMAIEGVLARVPSSPSLEIIREGISIEEKASSILDRLAEEGGLSFSSLFAREESRLAVIVTFLALLELMKRKVITITQRHPFGPIQIWRSK